MRTVTLDIRGELLDHVDPARRGGLLAVEIELPAGFRDVVQSCGIPHGEVAEVEVDRVPASWDRRLDAGDVVVLRPRYPLDSMPSGLRFVLDVHLGKLARHLRLLGCDAAYGANVDDLELVTAAAAPGAFLLTRDRGLLMRAAAVRGRWIRAVDPEEQAAEVVRAYALAASIEPFVRCLACNALVERYDPEPGEIPAAVRERHDTYQRCPGCGRIYWAGSHHARLEEALERILARAASGKGP